MIKKGQQLVEYGLILGCILLFCIMIIYLFSEHLEKFFELSSISNSANNELMGVYDSQNIPYIDSYPKEVCEDGFCNIDFGDFQLTDVPQNFDVIVDSLGSSGVTDKIVSLLYQLAEQMEANGDPRAESIKILANKGHNVARLEETIVNSINACNNDSICLQNLGSQYIDIPDGFIVDPANNMVFNPITYGVGAAALINSDSDYLSHGDRSTEPGAVFYGQFYNIINDPNIDSTIKGIITKFGTDIDTIADSSFSSLRYDWQAGRVPNLTRLDYIKTAPILTDYDSKIICYSGSYDDENNQCE